MKNLFISFSSIYYLLKDKQISWPDLETGLFFFGYQREHVLGNLPTLQECEDHLAHDPHKSRFPNSEQELSFLSFGLAGL